MAETTEAAELEKAIEEAYSATYETNEAGQATGSKKN